MTFHEIRKKILSLEKYFLTKTDAGPRPDTPARAVVEGGLRCRVHSPDGKSIFTDMSASLGGSATANSPGWLSRAAIASCDATLLAIRAAYQGIELDSIEVNVYASSDGRGMILDEGILPGSSEIRVLFDISARKASAEQVREIRDRYGARYFLDVAGCLYLLSARGFRELARWAQPSQACVATVVAIFVALNLSAAAVLPSRLALYRGYYEVSGELERQLEATGLEEAVILVDEESWEPWGEGARLMTGPRRHEIIIAADLEDNSVITTAYPERPVFRWDGEGLLPDDREDH